MDQDKLSLCLERLDEFIPHMVRRLHAELAQNMVGITGSQFVVLKKIRDRGRVTVSEVAEDLCVSLSAVTSLVDRLHKMGLVIRSRDEQDRRLVWIELTGEGEKAVSACQLARKKVIGKYFGQLPAEDIEHLVRINEKLLAIINADEQ